MTKLVKPTPEQWAVLQELGMTTGTAYMAVIAPEQQELLSRLYNPEDLEALEDRIREDYDCGGGDPELMTDIVTSVDHHLFVWLDSEAKDLGITPNDIDYRNPEATNVPLQRS